MEKFKSSLLSHLHAQPEVGLIFLDCEFQEVTKIAIQKRCVEMCGEMLSDHPTRQAAAIQVALCEHLGVFPPN